MSAVCVVDDEEYEALDALLCSAEKHLGRTHNQHTTHLGGCKRQAAVSPGTLKRQEQPAVGQGKSLFLNAAPAAANVEPTAQQTPCLSVPQHTCQPHGTVPRGLAGVAIVAEAADPATLGANCRQQHQQQWVGGGQVHTGQVQHSKNIHGGELHAAAAAAGGTAGSGHQLHDLQQLAKLPKQQQQQHPPLQQGAPQLNGWQYPAGQQLPPALQLPMQPAPLQQQQQHPLSARLQQRPSLSPHVPLSNVQHTGQQQQQQQGSGTVSGAILPNSIAAAQADLSGKPAALPVKNLNTGGGNRSGGTCTGAAASGPNSSKASTPFSTVAGMNGFQPGVMLGPQTGFQSTAWNSSGGSGGGNSSSGNVRFGSGGSSRTGALRDTQPASMQRSNSWSVGQRGHPAAVMQQHAQQDTRQEAWTQHEQRQQQQQRCSNPAAYQQAAQITSPQPRPQQQQQRQNKAQLKQELGVALLRQQPPQHANQQGLRLQGDQQQQQKQQQQPLALHHAGQANSCQQGLQGQQQQGQQQGQCLDQGVLQHGQPPQQQRQQRQQQALVQQHGKSGAPHQPPQQQQGFLQQQKACDGHTQLPGAAAGCSSNFIGPAGPGAAAAAKPGVASVADPTAPPPAAAAYKVSSRTYPPVAVGPLCADLGSVRGPSDGSTAHGPFQGSGGGGVSAVTQGHQPDSSSSGHPGAVPGSREAVAGQACVGHLQQQKQQQSHHQQQQQHTADIAAVPGGHPGAAAGGQVAAGAVPGSREAVVGQACMGHQQQHHQQQQQQQQQHTADIGGRTPFCAASGAVGPCSNSRGVAAGGAAAGSGQSLAASRRKLPSSLAVARNHTSSSTAGSSGGSGGSCYPPQQQQQAQQQQQQRGRAVRVSKQLPWAGRVRYACTAADVDAACRQLLAAGPPTVVGFDVEWKPSFVKGSPPNKAALVQLAYACEGGQDWRPKVEGQGRGVVVLLLHILHSGITPKLQEVLLDDHILKLGVNIGGDVIKLATDYGVQVFGTLDLSDAAHGHQLRVVEGITANIQPRKWSLAGLIEEVLDLELPKPQHIRMGDWERKPLTPEQQRYAAMDAWACLLLHWELQQLPTRQTLSQQLIEAMRQRAAAETDT